MSSGDHQAAERSELLAFLRGSLAGAANRAALISEPHPAYQPLPPGMVTDPARVLTRVQIDLRVWIEGYLFDLASAPRLRSSFEPPEPGTLIRYESAFPLVLAEYTSETTRVLALLTDVDLDALSARPVWVGEEHKPVTARWILLRRLASVSAAGGSLRLYFDLAQGGCLVDS